MQFHLWVQLWVQILSTFNLLISLPFEKKMAERTGLEPAAFRVTGGRYNQLNYHSVKYKQL